MKIELDLDQMLGFEYDGEGEPVGQKDFRNEVVIAAANMLIGEYRHEIKGEVRKQVSDVIESEIRGIVTEAMAGPIQKMTAWGEKVGTPMTILEMVRTELEKFLSGTTSGSDRFGNRKPENLRQLVEEASREVMTKELREAVAEAKAGITKEITHRALEAAVKTLTVGVKA